MSKMQRLLKGEYPVSDTPIVPRPDVEVEFIGEKTAVVRSVKHLGEWRVVDLVQEKRPGNWIFPISWNNVIDGDEIEQPNPHINTDGYWVWLLKKT